MIKVTAYLEILAHHLSSPIKSPIPGTVALIDFQQHPELLSAALEAQLGLDVIPVFIATQKENHFHWHFFNPGFRRLVELSAMDLRDLSLLDLIKQDTNRDTLVFIEGILQDGGTFVGRCQIGAPLQESSPGDLFLQVSEPDEEGVRILLGSFPAGGEGPAAARSADKAMQTAYRDQLQGLQVLLNGFATSITGDQDTRVTELTRLGDQLEQWIDQFTAFGERTPARQIPHPPEN